MMPRFQTGAIVAGFAAVAILAVAGWARKPALAPAYNTSVPYTTDAALPPAASSDAVQPVRYDQYGTAVPCAPAAPAQPGATPAFATRSAVRTVRPSPVVQTQAAPVYQPRRVVKRGRSVKKSVAIVAGSAGVGAAIGALAGGAGGFVYDRLTHNR